MAPEYLYKQVNEISSRFDIYSLGLIIIEITLKVKNCAGVDQGSARDFISKVSGNATRICEDFFRKIHSDMYFSLSSKHVNQYL